MGEQIIGKCNLEFLKYVSEPKDTRHLKIKKERKKRKRKQCSVR